MYIISFLYKAYKYSLRCENYGARDAFLAAWKIWSRIVKYEGELWL